jgi:hypothetical protein
VFREPPNFLITCLFVLLIVSIDAHEIVSYFYFDYYEDARPQGLHSKTQFAWYFLYY